MSISIMEILENARYNMDGQLPQVQLPLAKDQLDNAIKALENGYGIYETFEDYMLTKEKE